MYKILNNDINIKLKDKFQIKKGQLNYMKGIVKRFCPNIYIFLGKIKKKFKVIRFKEKRVRYGLENKDKTFYIIWRKDNTTGLLSNYHHVLGHIIYAIQKGYIPIVDMEKHRTIYSENTAINGTYNAWEYYFDQPMNYSLKEIYRSRNVILSSGEYPFNEIGDINSIYMNNDMLDKHHKLINNYIRVNKNVQNHVNSAVERKIIENTPVIGVFLRGTDYCYKKPKGHPVQPSIEEIINKVKELKEEWKVRYIYLVNEEESTLQKFTEEFGIENILYPKQERIKNYDGSSYIGDILDDRENARYLKQLEYLVAIILLSKCKYLIASLANGSVTALEMNGRKYEDVYIFDLGLY